MGGGDGGLAMLTTQPLHSTGAVGNTTNSSSGAFVKSEDATENQFPAGLRVLVVDDDPICLMMLDTLLRRCLYKVTTCGQATKALSMLRENRDNFDLVISDVCMPDMDGFKLLELVGLEMDLPVIMMSANGETSAVMKGITHGACDYLLKPVRIEELRNIWQHVVRKKRKEVHENKPYGSADHEPPKQGADDGERLSPPYDSCDGRLTKKRKEIKEEDDENEDENDDPSTTKKPRVVWSVELHQQFVNAVNHLGIDKAVPKRILELMNMQGLTRENVASHLQKYRLYLKRLSGVSNQQVGMNLAFGGILDPSFSPLTKLDGLGDLKALVASGQLPSHTLASLQTGILNRLNMPSNVGMGSLNSPGISLMSLQGINGTTLGRPQVAPHSLTNQGGLLPSIPSVGSGQFSKSQQITDAGQLSTPIEDIVQMNVLQQQLAGASGLGSSGHAGGMIHGSFPMNSSNNTFRTQLLQHQQQQIRSPGLTNLPTGLLGQCLISSENSLIGGNELLGGGMLAKGPCISTTANISGSFTRMPNSKSLNLPTATHCSFTAPSSVGVSSASLPAGCSFSSTMLKDVTAFTGRDASKSHGGFSDQVDSLGLRGSLGKPPVLIDNMDLGFTHELNQNTRQSWQAKQVCSPTLSSRFGQVPLCQNLSSGLGQSQVVHSQQLNLQPRSPNDQIPIMPHAQCNNEQTAAENSLRLRDQPLPDTLSGTKIEGGLASKHSPSADDLLNIFFRQHQEGTSFAGDLTSDGYSLQNMYMM